jgi:RNA polymerase sigma-70 factor, ECF subfamily
LKKEDLSDESLMLQYGEGDADAFEMLYGRHKDALYRFVRRQCSDREIAYDLAHDIWIKIIKARRRYRPNARFTTYLFTLARNRMIDYYRAQGHRLPAMGEMADPVDIEELPNRNDDGPEMRAYTNELVEHSLALIQALPQDQREAVLLYVERPPHGGDRRDHPRPRGDRSQPSASRAGQAKA